MRFASSFSPSRLLEAALLPLVWFLSPAPLSAQGGCRPPNALRVCQDTYGDKGRVFLVWTNGETTYSKLRAYLDGNVAGEAPGNANLLYIDSIAPGDHTFSVEGFCGVTPTARATASYSIVTSTPHGHPIESMECSFDASRSRLVAKLVLSSRPSLFIDVYVRRAGINGLIYVKTVPGNAAVINIDGALESDRLRLQFFDESCYGSELIGCPGPSCLPVLDLKVCQDIYGAESRVFLLWVPAAVDYTSYDILLDGAKVGNAAGNGGLFYIQALSPGKHVFGIRGLCGNETTDIVSRTMDILSESPHAAPARNLHCAFDAAQATLTATWLPGSAASEFIDVYVKHPGDTLLDFAGTIQGDRTRVRARNVQSADQMVLQFFNTSCYGSPLIFCGKDDAGSRNFIRGDGNGSGKVDLSDAVFSLAFLFLGDLSPLCFDAADANDDGKLNIADPIFTLSWLFGGGAAPPAPGPLVCGVDATTDTFPACLTAACE